MGGEFGRTPTVELPTPGANAGKINGRDHNHHGFTMWMAGGGAKGGTVYGATDEFGFRAEVNRMHVHDLHATMLAMLGFDHEKFTFRHAGRDFRLTDVDLYPTWYGEPHAAPDLLAGAAYGLPELFRSGLPGAGLVAVPGCYPTAAALALAPFLRAGAIEPGGIVVDAASGVSGAGRGPKPGTTFCAVDEDFSAYGLTGGTADAPTGHRHTPEIEQAISTAADGSVLEATAGVSVLFTPHLAPMNRGILATCYAEPTVDMDSTSALAVLSDAYEGEPFIVVSERSPSTKATAGSNTAHLTARVDPRTGLLVVVSAIDNLVKGASGQAVQCANIASGIDETTGLPTVGIYP